MNATVIVALIAAISAIVAPFITTVINNRHQMKMKEIEIYEQQKINVINGYFAALEAYIYNHDKENLIRFSKYQDNIFLYTPAQTWNEIEDCNTDLSELVCLIDNPETEDIRENNLTIFTHTQTLQWELSNLARKLSPIIKDYYCQKN